MKCNLTHHKPGKFFAKAAKAAGVVSITLNDNGDNTGVVLGQDAAGNPPDGADISALAAITVVSDNTAIMTVDAIDLAKPTSFAFHAVGPLGTCNLTIVVTFTSGTPAPITIALPATVAAGPTTGVVVQLGTPTAH